tara:strand:- start:42 stop:221 length:180 start_codon:yes stop_codon:yes gene_type:complete
MKVKMYPLIEQIVESGIDAGWRRAHKLYETPDSDRTMDTIQQYIMHGFNEAFKFDQEEV